MMAALKRRGPMRIRLLLLVVGLLSACAVEAQPARLDGTWTAVSAERNGASAPDVVGHKLAFSGNTFAITRDGKTLFAGTYTADLAAQPARIDFVNTEATLRGTWKGIARRDGGTLRICDNAPDMTKPRPSAFAAPAGSGYVCIAFARS
jgi:uncharacterized protein (TIGR03067 family)